MDDRGSATEMREGKIKREINEKMDLQVRCRNRPYNYSILDTFEESVNEIKTNSKFEKKDSFRSFLWETDRLREFFLLFSAGESKITTNNKSCAARPASSRRRNGVQFPARRSL